MTPLDETKLVWDQIIKTLEGYKKRGTVPWKSNGFFRFKEKALEKALGRKGVSPFFGCPLCERHITACVLCPLGGVKKDGEYYTCETEGPYQFYKAYWGFNLDRCIEGAIAFRKYLDTL